MTHSKSNVEDERKKREIDLRLYRNELQRNARALRPVARHWAPRDRHIDIAARDSVDDLRRWTLLRIVTVNRVAFDVVDDSAIGECMCRRRIRPVVSNELDADANASQNRIIERARIDVSIAARHEDIGRAIVR